MRGTQMVSIVTLVAYAGLMPSEQYSGTRTQRQREEAPVRDLHSLGRRTAGTRL